MLPEDPELDGEGVVPKPDEPEVEAGAAGAAGPGVGVDSARGGGSLVDSAEGDVCGAGGAARGITTLRRERAEAANVSRARDPAAPPRITPKPRKTSTSSADTRGDGSVNPSANSDGPGRAEDRGSAGAAEPGRPPEPGGPGDSLQPMDASGARCARPRRSNSTS